MGKSGQKEAVINEVLTALPGFRKGQDSAITLLTAGQLEAIKATIAAMITNGLVEYSKDITNISEVRTYARSMVMNHLKKAKELNGGTTYVSASSGSNNSSAGNARTKVAKVTTPKGVNPDLLTPELREFVKTELSVVKPRVHVNSSGTVAYIDEEDAKAISDNTFDFLIGLANEKDK